MKNDKNNNNRNNNRNNKNSKNNKNNILINVLLVLCMIAMVVFSALLIKTLLDYRESRKEYEGLQEYVFLDEMEPEVSAEPEDSENTEQDNESKETEEEGTKVLVKKEPTCSITVDFASLWEINPDVKGWIYLEALDISYPIVQGENNDEYLYTTVRGTANKSGSIFMESLNAGDFSDPHTLIYGHNMKDGSMFGDLKDLYNQDFVDKLETVLCFWIITPEGTYRYDIFSIHTTAASGETYTLFSGEGDEVGDYMNSMARKTGVELPQRVYNSKDKVVTLSTCTGNDAYRLVVQGVLHVD